MSTDSKNVEMPKGLLLGIQLLDLSVTISKIELRLKELNDLKDGINLKLAKLYLRPDGEATEEGEKHLAEVERQLDRIKGLKVKADARQKELEDERDKLDSDDGGKEFDKLSEALKGSGFSVHVMVNPKKDASSETPPKKEEVGEAKD